MSTAESGRVVVRPMTFEDLPQIAALGRRVHAESRYAWLPYEEAQVQRTALEYLDEPERRVALLAFVDGALAGLLAGYLLDCFFSSAVISCDMVFLVDREYRGSPAAGALIQAFQRWSTERGAKEMCLGVSSKIATGRTEALYQALGYEPVGGLFAKRLG